MQTFDFSGIRKMLQSQKGTPTATERALRNLSRSSVGSDSETRLSSRDTFSITQNISELLSPACGMTEEEKSNYLEKIMAKLKSGKRLTPEEMRFLQAEAPELYQQVARVQTMRDSLTARLKQCSSKEEAADVYSQTLSLVSDKDPAKEFIIAAYEDAYKEFQKSDGYQALPNTKKEAEEEKETSLRKN